MYVAIASVAALFSVCLTATVFLFNRLVRLRNRTQAAWHGLETELQRRYALIPLLAGIAKGYAARELEALEIVSLLRSKLDEGINPKEGSELFRLAEQRISMLLAKIEAYPSLKADKTFRELERKLLRTESVVANARKYYNACVMHYDNARQSLPGALVAHLFRGSFPSFPFLQSLQDDDEMS